MKSLRESLQEELDLELRERTSRDLVRPPQKERADYPIGLIADQILSKGPFTYEEVYSPGYFPIKRKGENSKDPLIRFR